MIVNLPFGGNIEIKDEEYDHKFAYGKRYRFKIIDKYGRGISKDIFRDIKISSLIGDDSSYDILYHIHLSNSDTFNTASVNLDLKKSELIISGDNINVKFKCTSLYQAEDIIDMILEYKVAPFNRDFTW